MSHPNYNGTQAYSLRLVLSLGAVISLMLAAIAGINWWPAELIAALASGVIFAAANLSVVVRQQNRRINTDVDELRAMPSGPTTRFVADEPGWKTETTHTPQVARTVIEGGQKSLWQQEHDAFTRGFEYANDIGAELTVTSGGHTRSIKVRPATPPGQRGPWWRRLWARLTPWWVIASSPLLLIPVGLMFPNGVAHALDYRPTVNVSVMWTGAPDCIQAWVPDPDYGNQLAKPVSLCGPMHYYEVTTTGSPRTGDWIGIDPEMSGAEDLSCSVRVNGVVVVSDYATRGDGEEVTCLARW